jgi:hypothetical protein
VDRGAPGALVGQSAVRLLGTAAQPELALVELSFAFSMSLTATVASTLQLSKPIAILPLAAPD